MCSCQPCLHLSSDHSSSGWGQWFGILQLEHVAFLMSNITHRNTNHRSMQMLVGRTQSTYSLTRRLYENHLETGFNDAILHSWPSPSQNIIRSTKYISNQPLMHCAKCSCMARTFTSPWFLSTWYVPQMVNLGRGKSKRALHSALVD